MTKKDERDGRRRSVDPTRSARFSCCWPRPRREWRCRREPKREVPPPYVGGYKMMKPGEAQEQVGQF